MSLSRRNFIKLGSISAAVIAGGSLGFNNAAYAQNVQEIYGDLLASYNADTFGKFVGSPFTLVSENFAETSVLTEVRESEFSKSNLKSKPQKGGKIVPAEDFMLSFRISNGDAKQATYTVIHQQLGQFDLLLVPAQNEGGEFLLNAVINRL